MADKDEEFLDGDDAGAAGDSKEGGKPKKGPFASAMVMQILKWAAIVVGFIILVVTISVVVNNLMGADSQKNKTLTESPEYHTKPIDAEWYSAIEQIRGETADEESHYRYTMKLNLGYEKGDKEIPNELVDRQIQITDMLMQWFSSQEAAYLRNKQNRESIREQLKQEINKMLNKQIIDVRFSEFDIISLE